MNVDNKDTKVKTAVPPKGQARITCPPQLATGLDTLKISFWIDWEDETLLDELQTIKRQIQNTQNHNSLPYHCPGGFDWNLHRTGTSMYNYRLSSGDLSLLINTRRHDGNIPNLRFEVGSQSCWIPGYEDIYNRFIQWISALGGNVKKEIISEAHITTDFIGVPVKETNIHKRIFWISQAQKFGTYQQGRNFSGITIGKGDISLRIYDKVMELSHNHPKQQTFSEIWNTKSYDEKPVTRVEFQLRRAILKDFKLSESAATGVDTFSDLMGSLSSLWIYCTHHWARHCSTPVDHKNNHQSRVSISDFWKLVSGVSWKGTSDYTKYKPQPNKDITALRKQFRGLGMSIASFNKVHVEDLDHIIGIAKDTLEDDLISFYRDDETEFIRRMEKKKREIFNAVSSPNLPTEACYE